MGLHIHATRLIIEAPSLLKLLIFMAFLNFPVLHCTKTVEHWLPSVIYGALYQTVLILETISKMSIGRAQVREIFLFGILLVFSDVLNVMERFLVP